MRYFVRFALPFCTVCLLCHIAALGFVVDCSSIRRWICAFHMERQK